MQDNRCSALDLNNPPVARVQRLHESMRRAVKLPVPGAGREGEKEKHQVAQHDHHPIEAGENSVENDAPPQPVIFLEVEIECLVVGPIAQVMPEMSLPKEMERSGKKQRHDAAEEIIPE